MAAFLALFGAIAFEIASTLSLPKTREFHDLPWTATVLVGYGVSFWLLTLALREIQVSTTYAIWSGVGTAATAILATVFLGDTMTWTKAFWLGVIIAGVIGLNLSGTTHA
ncbi:DMT family transporter [Nocardioides sp. Kera G14]|uniref:DMT family transporter n=1 Tax=Nocardioides sp. Kera G14 TaxID=2884264 RepID=UPI001D0FBC43|nr:multidrug efflux SMR transporter [Nocardioides sp. Kera G14]UDY22865.1 multidrug efflux SMR transporter [Nocardioides sp. Kera G14]